MQLRRSPVATLAAALAVALGVAAPQFAAPQFAGADERPAWCFGTGPIDVTKLPQVLAPVAGCDLTGREVVAHGISLFVPGKGFGVDYSEVVPAGHSGRVFRADQRTDGTVEFSYDVSSADTTEPGSSPLVVDPCNTTAYTNRGIKAYTWPTFYYNAANVPSSVTSTAQNAIEVAVLNLTNGYNDCGLTQVPDTFYNYGGTTNRTVGVTSTGCAGTQDGFHVTGWGSFTASSVSLARACTWRDTSFNPDKLVDGDIKYNTDYSWTTTLLLCLNSYDLQSVATSMWGYVFGLGNVAESGTTSSQTMSTNSDGPCQAAERTLGKGDLTGMIAIYGEF